MSKWNVIHPIILTCFIPNCTFNNLRIMILTVPHWYGNCKQTENIILSFPLFSHTHPPPQSSHCGILRLSYLPIIKPSACTGIQHSPIPITSETWKWGELIKNGPLFMLPAEPWTFESFVSNSRVLYFLDPPWNSDLSIPLLSHRNRRFLYCWSVLYRDFFIVIL